MRSFLFTMLLPAVPVLFLLAVGIAAVISVMLVVSTGLASVTYGAASAARLIVKHALGG